MPRSTEIEIGIAGQWRRSNVEDALAINERYGRCVECHEDVRVHARGKNGAAAHVEHRKRNPEHEALGNVDWVSLQRNCEGAFCQLGQSRCQSA